MVPLPATFSSSQIDIISSTIDESIHDWIKQSDVPTYSEKWFLQARDEALLSNFHTAKVGCVITYKNHVIGKGHNQRKTDPYQKKYNQEYRKWTLAKAFGATAGHTIHAEIAALKSIPYPIARQIMWKRVQVYVYRVGIGLEGFSGLALPCQACAHALQDMGIRNVYYTTGRLDEPFGHCSL